jgi:hypothetical protein
MPADKVATMELLRNANYVKNSPTNVVLTNTMNNLVTIFHKLAIMDSHKVLVMHPEIIQITIIITITAIIITITAIIIETKVTVVMCVKNITKDVIIL